MREVALQDLQVLAQSLLALALGGLVGWERETSNKGAGLRTMMLVSFASFLFVKVSLFAGLAFADGGEVRTDPIRAVQALVTGLGFVGAGIVFHERENGRVRGLTTAATLLAVAPVGIAVALDRYVLAVGTTLLLLVVLRVMAKLEDRFFD
jgi:putative Mg2+ transporter-C (MgtC) family protein